jgi:competence protein ComEC
MLAVGWGLFLSCFAVVWAPGISLVWIGVSLLVCLIVYAALDYSRLFLVALLVGGLLSSLHVTRGLDQEAQAHAATSTVTGTVEGLVRGDESVLRFDFVVDQPESPHRAQRLRVSWRDADFEPASGERWQLPLRYEHRDAILLPGEFDRARWQFRHGIHATARVDSRRTALRLSSSGTDLGAFRTRLSRDLERLLDGSDGAALIRGVTVGDRSGFTAAQWEVLNGTGTTHLVAISGLHIGLVGGLVFALLRLPARQWPGRQPAMLLAGLGALVCAAAYAALAGFALPTQRALTMFTCLIVLLALRRRTRLSSGLALAGSLVLLLDPLAVMDPGFYLSFALVALVLMVVAAGDRPGALQAFVKVQWVTGLAVLPLLLLFFAIGPLSSPVANAVAVPVFSFVVVPLALLGTACLSLQWEGLARPLLQWAEWVLDQLWWVLEWLHAGPVISGSDTAGILLLMLGLLATLALILPGPLAPRLVFLLALLPALMGPRDSLAPKLDAWALNDGGQLWRIQQGGEALFWASGSGADLAYSQRAWLRRQGQRSDSVLVMNVGEGLGPGRLDPVVRAFPTGRVFLSDAGRVSPGPARHCGAGSVGSFFLSREGRGTDSACRLEWALPSGQLRLDDQALVFHEKAGEGRWCLGPPEREAHFSARIGRDGRLQRMAQRGYWWRPAVTTISDPEPNKVSCSGVLGP